MASVCVCVHVPLRTLALGKLPMQFSYIYSLSHMSTLKVFFLFRTPVVLCDALLPQSTAVWTGVGPNLCFPFQKLKLSHWEAHSEEMLSTAHKLSSYVRVWAGVDARTVKAVTCKPGVEVWDHESCRKPCRRVGGMIRSHWLNGENRNSKLCQYFLWDPRQVM